jgi:predicted secreted protein
MYISVFILKGRMMESTLIRRKRTGQTRMNRAPLTWARLVALAILGIVGWDRPAQADGLRWKLKPGEVLRYVVEEKTTQTSKEGERENKGSTTRTTNLTWSVKGVSDAGDADIVLKYERVRMHIEQPPFMPFDLDSNVAKADAPDPFGAILNQFKAMAGAEFTFRLKPNGAIENVKIPENTLKKLRAAIPDAASQGTFSEQGLKDLLAQSTAPAFPDNASEPGSSWTGKPSKIATPIGNIVEDWTFTTQGPDPKNSGVLLIGTETKVSIEPPENAGVSAKVESQESKGSMAFDTANGRILSTRRNQKMQLLLTQPADPSRKLEQKTETTYTMALEP